MKITLPEWIAGTVLTILGTVLMVLGFKEYIPLDNPLWLIIFGVICIGIGSSIMKKM